MLAAIFFKSFTCRLMVHVENRFAVHKKLEILNPFIPTLGQDPMTAMLPHFLATDMTVENSYTIERFVREAAQGRVETVKKILPKMKDRVNN